LDAADQALSGQQHVCNEFTVPQIVGLLTWISLAYAGQMLGLLIGDERGTAEEKEAFAASVTSPRPSP
jgi:hypothetical protein